MLLSHIGSMTTEQTGKKLRLAFIMKLYSPAKGLEINDAVLLRPSVQISWKDMDTNSSVCYVDQNELKVRRHVQWEREATTYPYQSRML